MKKIMRKGIALVVLTLFILSVVPMALAEPSLKGRGKTSATVGVSTGALAAEVDLQADADAEASVDSSTEETETTPSRKGSVEDEKPLRGTKVELRKLAARIDAKAELTQEQLQQMRERVAQAKERYEQAREMYKEQKEKLSDLRGRHRECKEDDSSETCVKVRKDVSVGVKNHLLKTVELIDHSLTRLTEHVQSSTVLSEEDKQSILTSINTLQEKVTAEKERVLALAETATAVELRSEVKELKKLWQDVSKQQRRIVSMMTSAKMDNLVEKHADLVESMQKKIDAAKEKGIDTAELEAILADFKAAVDTLTADQEKARAFWQGAENMSKESLDQWHRAQQVVKDDLQETRKLLRSFVRLSASLKLETSANTSTTPSEEVSNSEEEATAEE
ncbi:hypothetical protein HY496_01605 [Candidatus Woesearchaeota archaeon]|nr:hypothetical protein [Candidatus Woesearchaeota archaeon]